MLRATGSATLQGLQLRVADLDAAASLVGQVFGLPSTAREADGAASFRLGSRWLLLQRGTAEQADCLHWQCTDLAAQRALLAQLGIEGSDDAGTATADDRLQVAGVDTGACATSWTEGLRAPASAATPRLSGVLLHARAPERVAAHWSQMLQTPLGRSAAGLPRLMVDGVALSFAFAEEGVGGVRELTLGVDQPAHVHERARTAGVARCGDTLSLGGLTIRIV